MSTSREPALTINLFDDFRGLSARLADQLNEEQHSEIDEPSGMSAFLLAAGLHQIIEDYLHREAPVFRRAARRFGSYEHPLASLAARVVSMARATISEARQLRPRERRLIRWADVHRQVLERLAAAAVLDGEHEAKDEARRLWSAIYGEIAAFPPSLLASVVSLPNTFATFDQLPEDCAELVRRFSARWPDREGPILVVGIRTSGTYLAPLHAAFLRKQGYRDVQVLTVRPAQHWRSAEPDLIRNTGERGGVVLLTDDPPRTGNSVARVAAECMRRGVAGDSIVLALQLLGPTESLPKTLGEYPAVLLPWHEWAIHQRLSPPVVQEALARLLVGREIWGSRSRKVRVTGVHQVERLEPSPVDTGPRRRRHVQAVVRARLSVEGGEDIDHQIYIRGAGLGYFGTYPRAVASAIAEYLPEFYGVEGGLLYRAWLPSEWKIEAGSDGLEARVASYVLARRRRLAVDANLAARAVAGSGSCEVVADALGQALLGTLRTLVFPFTWLASRRLIAARRASVVDGNMDASNWFVPPSAGSAAGAFKASPDEHSFRNAAKLSYDPIFDLASAAASFEIEELLDDPNNGGKSFPERLLESFADLSGEEVDAERWFLYQVVHHRSEHQWLLDRLRDGSKQPELHVRRLLATERALARAGRRYFADLYLADLTPPAAGPLCAIDVDWVLETLWLDSPAITPNGALALRALARHGFRPVIATGRSIGELRERCRTYRLAGGVAEYGAVVYNHRSGRLVPQLPAPEQVPFSRLREALTAMPGVHLDPAYRYGVRAIRIVDGARRGLDDETVTAALAAADAERSVQVLWGHRQTDFAPISLDKGTGLRALARELGADSESAQPLAFAIGDDAPDLPMLALAERAYVPANATTSLQDRLADWPSIKLLDRSQGAGVLEAAASFLGHHPARCRVCGPPMLSPRTSLVTIPFAAADGRPRDRFRQSAHLATALLRRTGGGERLPR